MPLPLTAAQRQAKRKQKLKDHNDYEDYKRKDALRKRLKRAEKKQKDTGLPADEQDRLQAECRKQTSSNISSIQKCTGLRQSLLPDKASTQSCFA